MYCLTNLLFFDIPLLYYVNLNSSIICCLFSGDIYLSFGFSRFNWITHFYICYLNTKVKFILSSISNDWLFWSVDHTSMAWNSELNVFKKVWFFGEISNKLPNGLLGTNLYKTLESYW